MIALYAFRMADNRAVLYQVSLPPRYRVAEETVSAGLFEVVLSMDSSTDSPMTAICFPALALLSVSSFKEGDFDSELEKDTVKAVAVRTYPR